MIQLSITASKKCPTLIKVLDMARQTNTDQYTDQRRKMDGEGTVLAKIFSTVAKKVDDGSGRGFSQ